LAATAYIRRGSTAENRVALWWQHRSGAFSWIRAAALVASAAPAVILGAEAAIRGLGSRPVTIALHIAGDWAVRFLLISLAVSPLRRLLRWNELHPARQIFGLASFAYAALHVGLYVVDQKYALGRVLSEIVQRLYLAIGSVAFIGLLILAVNSGERAIQRLGSAEWQALHRWVYALVPLVLLHYFIQSKLDVTQPLLMTGLAIWLLGYRVLPSTARTSPAALALLAAMAAVGTQAIELAWYAVATRVSASSIAEGIFDFDSEIRSMWYVLCVTLPFALTPFLISGKPRSTGRAA
jgi:sulfoxide reductase heme-binding subunit YedZ